MGYVDLIEKPVKANIWMEEVFKGIHRNTLEMGKVKSSADQLGGLRGFLINAVIFRRF